MKKQSQFVSARIGAKSYVKGEYDNKPAGGAEENKANQACPEHVEWSQSHVPEPAKGAGKRDKSVAAATG
ncbi:MAG: hypothetical protein WBC05_05915 [Sedimentisphaerales bacterium]